MERSPSLPPPGIRRRETRKPPPLSPPAPGIVSIFLDLFVAGSASNFGKQVDWRVDLYTNFIVYRICTNIYCWIFSDLLYIQICCDI